MQLWGKLLGTIFGFMFAKLPGALLGLFVGHLFDRSFSASLNRGAGVFNHFRSNPLLADQAIFYHTFFACLGHVLKAKGRVTELDIAVASAVMDQLSLSATKRKEAQLAFTEGKSAQFPLKETLENFRQASRGRREILQFFLEMQLQCTFIESLPSLEQRKILERIALTFRFTRNEFQRLYFAFEAERRFHRHSSGKSESSKSSEYNERQKLIDAYKILEIDDANCSNRELKKAYKKVIAKHHPDKLQSQGLPKEAMELAKQKSQDISNAYELIKKQRGL